MTKLSKEQLLKVQQNLKINDCPNCGHKGNKDVSPEEFSLLSLDIDSINSFDPNKMGSLPVIISCCPNCGVLSLFNRKVICN